MDQQGRLLHVQVKGSPTNEHLQEVAAYFNRALHEDPEGSTIVTDPSITCTNLSVPGDTPYQGIQVQGVVSPELIAQVTFDAQAALNIIIGQPSSMWHSATEQQKAEQLRAVQHVLREPSKVASTAHGIWLAQTQADGWTYGKTIDHEAKTHPYLLPYEALPVLYRNQQVLLRTLVASLYPRLPVPEKVSRPIQLFVEALDTWVDGDFMTLQPGYIWRYKDEVQAYLAMSTVYVAHSEKSAQYTVEAKPLVSQPPPATEGDVDVQETPAVEVEVEQGTIEAERDAFIEEHDADDGSGGSSPAPVDEGVGSDDWGSAPTDSPAAEEPRTNDSARSE